jgi:hypothetical protein
VDSLVLKYFDILVDGTRMVDMFDRVDSEIFEDGMSQWRTS